MLCSASKVRVETVLKMRYDMKTELQVLATLLASNASSYITGHGFIEDRGQTAKM